MLTVLLATKNRSAILRDVLESYSNLQTPSGGWKLVVIDNGSTDDTARVVSSFGSRFPIQYVFEGKAGKNSALNTGLELLEGDLAVFTDDDAFPRSNWLVELRKAADNDPAYSMFGGAIVPRWEAPPPDWIRFVELGPVYTLTDSSWKAGPIDAGFIFGPNMAIRSSVFRSGIRLDSAIGPRGSNYAMGSETELLLRVSRLGHKAWHVAAAVVEHLIRKDQLRKGWVWQRGLRFGRGQYRIAVQTGNHLAIPRFLALELFKKAARVLVAVASFNQGELFRSLWTFNYVRGQAIEARIIARERSAPAPSIFQQI